ncbi:MAG: hypothetical protein JWM09_910 [Francisellaceae bacterium]|nr:hypothetical protein [Francisellaceae bacterium]
MKTLFAACKLGDLEQVNLLLAQGADATADNNAPIRMAASYGHLDLVNRLLKEPRVDPTADNNYAICFAARNGHLNVVNRLLEVPGVDATDSNNFAIRFSAGYGRLDVVNRLLKVSSVDATAGDNFAIRWAVCLGHSEVIELITETLRLQILANFHAAYKKERLGEEEKSLSLDFLDAELQLKFKNAVLKKWVT